MTPSTDPWAGRYRRRDDERLLTRLASGTAGAGGALVLLRSRRVRRLAWAGAKFALTTWLPAWGMSQVRAAWTEAGPAPDVPALPPPADADRT